MKNQKLIDLCITGGEYGIAASAEPYDSNKYRYLRISDITDYGELNDTDKKSVSCNGCEKKLLNENDILFARTGNSTGRAFLYEPKYGQMVFAGYLIRFNLDPQKVNPLYMKYYTTSNTYKSWVNNGPDGSTRGNMNAGDFSDMPVFLPPRSQQDLLVNVSESITQKIRTNNAIISELEAMAKDIYDYWFVQFDFPNENGKPYKSSGGKMVWNEELKREIPEGWSPGTINTMANLSNTQIRPRSGVTYEHYSIPAYDEGRYPSFENGSLIESNKFIVNDDMILVSKLNPQFPRVWLPLVMTEFSICSTEMLPLIPKKQEYIPYLYLFLLSKSTTKSMISKSSCSTGSRKRIDPNVFMDISLVVPQKEIVSKFSSSIIPALEKVKIAIKENVELTSLRDFLLPLLMNGQVKVGTTEA